MKHQIATKLTLNDIIHLTCAGGQISAFSSPLFHANSKLTMINRQNVTKELGLPCIVRAVRCELILECCVKIIYKIVSRHSTSNVTDTSLQ